MTYDDAMADVAELLPLVEANEILLAIQTEVARLTRERDELKDAVHDHRTAEASAWQQREEMAAERDEADAQGYRRGVEAAASIVDGLMFRAGTPPVDVLTKAAEAIRAALGEEP